MQRFRRGMLSREYLTVASDLSSQVICLRRFDICHTI
jgi:hypothetical protein